MLKKFAVLGAALAVFTMGITNASATSVVVDFANAMDTAGLDSTTDDNNGAPTSQLNPNGELDSAEMALISAILANASLDLTGTGGTDHTTVHAAYTQALASASTDLAIPANVFPTLPTFAAGYAMLGTDSFDAISAFASDYGYPMNGNYALALALAPYLGPDGDADGDGATNAEEYAEYYPGGGASGYVAAALDPNVLPELSISNVSGVGSHLDNTLVTLSVTLSNTLGDETYQWQADFGSGFNNVSNGGNISGATSLTLTFNPIDFADAADYRIVITNSQTTLTSATYPMNVVATLPALDYVGLGAALIILALVAGFTLRRRVVS